jgi:hypothetical protein
LIRVGAVLLVASLASSAGEAQAAPLTVHLDYAAGPGCPDAADFRAVVIARLGYDPFSEGAPEHVLVRIEPRDRAIDGRIEWRDAGGKWAGEQAFPSVSTDCSRLVRAMGFALAVQIQLLAKGATPADATVEPSVEASPPPQAPAVETVSKPQIPVQPLKEQTVAGNADLERSTDSAARPVFAIGAGPSIGLGLSSSPVLLGRLFGAVTWSRL